MDCWLPWRNCLKKSWAPAFVKPSAYWASELAANPKHRRILLPQFFTHRHQLQSCILLLHSKGTCCISLVKCIKTWVRIHTDGSWDWRCCCSGLIKSYWKPRSSAHSSLQYINSCSSSANLCTRELWATLGSLKRSPCHWINWSSFSWNKILSNHTYNIATSWSHIRPVANCSISPASNTDVIVTARSKLLHIHWKIALGKHFTA